MTTESRLEKLRERLEFFGVDLHKASALAEDLKVAFVVSRSSPSDVETVCIGIEQATASGRLTGEELRSLSETAPFLETAEAPAKWTIKPLFGDSIGYKRALLDMRRAHDFRESIYALFRGDKA